MNRRLKALGLSGFLALSLLVTKPVRADEGNKRTVFEFSAPVEIPGKVLTPGKYVFEIADNQADRNIVKIFAEDANGNENMVATLLALPDYLSNTPDKPTIHFGERHAGTPEAIHSWFYPGENTGWAFVYLKGQDVQTSANTTPAPAAGTASAPVLAAASPGLPRAPKGPEAGPVPEARTMDEESLV